MEIEKEVLTAVQLGIGKVIQEHLGGYNSPLKKLIDQSFDERKQEFKRLIDDAISTIVLDKRFRQQMIEQIHHKIARQLSNEFGDGIFKKSINSLKSDPTLKAKCVLAIEKIIEPTPQEEE